MPARPSVGAVAVATSVSLCASLHAEPANQTESLPQIQVTAKHAAKKPAPRAPATAPTHAVAEPAAATPTASSAVAQLFAVPPVVERFQLPQESFSTTTKQIEETINIKDPEDAVKYFPSLFVRKRNDGAQQPA